MTDIEVALPFWLDRPDHEATYVALAAADTGFAALWIGEMATYDAFALATSIGAPHAKHDAEGRTASRRRSRSGGAGARGQFGRFSHRLSG